MPAAIWHGPLLPGGAQQQAGAGGTTIYAYSIASGEAFGSAYVRRLGYVSALSSAESFGTAQVRFIAKTLGISSAEALGNPAVLRIVRAVALASAEALGVPTVLGPRYLYTDGIPSAGAFGATRVARAIYGTKIDSLEALGLPTARRIVEDGTIGSGESVSTAGGARVVRAQGIASGEAHGTPTVSSGVFVYVTSIGSGEAFGRPRVLGPITLYAGGIASGEAFGAPTVAGGVPASTKIGSPWPVPHRGWSPPKDRESEPIRYVEPEPVKPPALTVGASSIESRERFGRPHVDHVLYLDLEDEIEAMAIALLLA